MSVSIITVGTEKRASLLEDSLCRVLAVGTNWTQLILFARLQVEDFGSTPSAPTPLFQIGMMVEPNSNLSNSPRGDTCPHFVGMDSRPTASWTRTLHATSPYPDAPYYSISAARVKKVNTTRTQGGSNAMVLSCAGIKECFGVQITKGSPWVVTVLYPAILQDIDVNSNQVLSFGEQPLLGTKRTMLHNYLGVSEGYTSSGNNITVDEATDGYLTSAVFTWNRPDFAMRLCDFFVLKTA